MPTSSPLFLARSAVVVSAAVLLSGCADATPLAPDLRPAAVAQRAAQPAGENATLATLRRATARYHNLNAAIADGFVFLHGCEVRPDEGPVGSLYVHFGRLLDGVIDPAAPDGLIYEPGGSHPKLVGVELAVPYPLWTGQAPPALHGTAFQREDEFGVFALHVWIWRDNPEGLFAETNPRVSCGEA